MPMHRERFLAPVGGLVEGRRHIANGHSIARRQVRPLLLVQEYLVTQGRLHVHDCGERLIAHVDRV